MPRSSVLKSQTIQVEAPCEGHSYIIKCLSRAQRTVVKVEEKDRKKKECN